MRALSGLISPNLIDQSSFKIGLFFACVVRILHDDRSIKVVVAVVAVVVVVVVVVVYFILSRLLFLAFSANLGVLCMPHSGMGPLVHRPCRRTAE